MNQISFQSVYNTITARGEFKLGQRASTPDGREWVFVQAMEALTNSSVVVPDAVTAADTVSSSTDGQGRIVYITEASAGWTVGAFEDAIGVVDDGTGKGQTFKIRTNSADTLTLYPETALTTALSVVDSDITIRQMANVDMAAVTSMVQSAVGANQVAFANADYGWALTNGDGRAVAGDTLVIGAGFTTGDDTEGQVIVAATTEGPYDAQNLGFALVANSAADMGALVRYNIR
jgi:hypothetical protein